MNQILTKEIVENFYNYGAPIDDKITLDTTLHGWTYNRLINMTDDENEECHGHVQILFPNVQPSKINPYAPIIADYSVFDNVYRTNILDAVWSFCIRYGFDPTIYCEGCKPRKNVIAGWLKKDNHNVLRMTRVMHFLKGVKFNIEFETMRNILLHHVEELDRAKELSYTTYIWRNI